MSTSVRSDTQIAADVRDTLKWDTRLQDGNVQVEVLDGIVILTGNVRLIAESSIAADDAWRVKGVRQVINNVAVSPTAERSDSDIAADVVNALKYDSRVDLKSIVVLVAGGVVTLTGTAGSTIERRAAEEDAWYTPGIVAVSNQINVSAGKQRPDEEILVGAREALTRDARIVDATRISVAVDHGKVTLTGGVDRPDERRAAEEDAWFTAGVIAVINHLTVSLLITE